MGYRRLRKRYGHARGARARLESAVWKRTHADYKSTLNGERAVLVLGPRGATLTPLSRLTDAELRKLGGR